MTLTATLITHKHRLNATLDPAIITQAKKNLYELAQDNGFRGSFDDFLATLKADNVNALISSDTGNTLTLGTDNKLYTNPLTKQDW